MHSGFHGTWANSSGTCRSGQSLASHDGRAAKTKLGVNFDNTGDPDSPGGMEYDRKTGLFWEVSRHLGGCGKRYTQDSRLNSKLLPELVQDWFRAGRG